MGVTVDFGMVRMAWTRMAWEVGRQVEGGMWASGGRDICKWRRRSNLFALNRAILLSGNIELRCDCNLSSHGIEFKRNMGLRRYQDGGTCAEQC